MDLEIAEVADVVPFGALGAGRLVPGGEAVERAAEREDTNYALGSVLNHVLLHQTVIGLECEKQLEMADDYPDVIVGCTGGGSNFAGIAFPFMGSELRGGKKLRVVAVEPGAGRVLVRRPHRRQPHPDRQSGHQTLLASRLPPVQPVVR